MYIMFQVFFNGEYVGDLCENYIPFLAKRLCTKVGDNVRACDYGFCVALWYFNSQGLQCAEDPSSDYFADRWEVDGNPAYKVRDSAYSHTLTDRKYAESDNRRSYRRYRAPVLMQVVKRAERRASRRMNREYIREQIQEAA